jgi:predicted PhzF superfamily epimerase YddE/YHI9
VGLRLSDAGIAFAAPPMIRSGPVDPALAATVADVLRLAPARIVAMEWVDNGPGWIGVLLASADEVLAVDADASRWTGEGTLDVGLVGPYPAGADCAFEVRALFTADEGGLREDPVTGSLNASLAQWLIGSGRATAPYVTSQGTRLGRAGRPHIDQDADGTIWIGGHTVTFVDGTLEI